MGLLKAFGLVAARAGDCPRTAKDGRLGTRVTRTGVASTTNLGVTKVIRGRKSRTPGLVIREVHCLAFGGRVGPLDGGEALRTTSHEVLGAFRALVAKVFTILRRPTLRLEMVLSGLTKVKTALVIDGYADARAETVAVIPSLIGLMQKA